MIEHIEPQQYVEPHGTTRTSTEMDAFEHLALLPPPQLSHSAASLESSWQGCKARAWHLEIQPVKRETFASEV